ncbi:MAG: FG-GAP-like repeat-containing protein [Blastocatellales bacterium]
MKHPNRTASLSIALAIGVLVITAAVICLPFQVSEANNAHSTATEVVVKNMHGGQPLEKVLNPDGSLNFEAGFSGSLDARGWRLEYAPDGAPRFVPLLASDDDNWDSQFSLPGMNGNVNAIAVTGNEVYVGGLFTSASNITANRVVKWNGSTWVPLGTGVDNRVNAIAISGSDVYVGGNFSTAGGVSASRIAKWNGSSWAPLGSGVDGNVNAIAISGNDVYVGGNFFTAGGVSASRIAKWNGNSWSPLSSGVNGIINAIAISGNDVYVGGNFSTAGGVNASRIAKWNGNNWSPLGSGVNSITNAIAISGNDVYVGGFFSIAGGVSASNIAKWNGNGWLPLGSGINNEVNAIAINGSDVYVGGDFSTAGGVSASRIAKWNGNSWLPLGSGVDSITNAIAISGSEVYAGGFFSIAGGVVASKVAQWSTSNWSSLGIGTGNGLASTSNIAEVRALTISGNNVYVGGIFSTAGGVVANRIAKWNGSSWSPLGNGVNGQVSAIGISGNDVYVGGSFTSAGGVNAINIAKWNGSSWSALGSGVDSIVNAIAINGNDVYVGGLFSIAGGTGASNIARWNGSNWNPLGSGVDGNVNAIAISGNDVYVGGSFLTAGGINASRIAKWNGSSWSPLGSGVDGLVFTIAISGNDVYVGGGFLAAGGVNASRIAKWDGSIWSALGGGVNNSANGIFAITIDGSHVYVGGDFTSAGGIEANQIAEWNGENWLALGSGVSGRVYGIGVVGSDIYVGGAFLRAGNKPSAAFGRYSTACIVPGIATNPVSQTVTTGSSVTFSVTATGTALSYQWRKNGSDIQGANGNSYTIAAATLADAGNYDVAITNGCGIVTSNTATLTVNCPTITLNPTSLPNGTAGTAYNQTITASPGGGNYTFAVTAGSLPPGISLDSATGSITGTPTTASTFNFTVRATDASGCMGERQYTLTITCGSAPVITSPMAGDVAGRVTITATGGSASLMFEVRDSSDVVVDSGIISGGSANWLAYNQPLGTYTIKVVDSSSPQCPSAPVTVNLKALIEGRLKVKDFRIPNCNDPNSSCYNIDNLPAGLQSTVTFYCGSNFAPFTVGTDGRFSSRPANGAVSSFEGELVNCTTTIQVTASLNYYDNIDVTTPPCALDMPPGGKKTRTASLNHGSISIQPNQLNPVDVYYPLPIFLHHGVLSCYTTWNEWAQALNNVGYIVFTPNHNFLPPGGIGPVNFYDYAAETKGQMDLDLDSNLGGLFTTPGGPQYYFITHSQGGVIARVLTYDWPDVRRQLQRVYTLAAPHSGTRLPGAELYSLHEGFMTGQFNVNSYPGFKDRDGRVLRSTSLVFNIAGAIDFPAGLGYFDGTDGVVLPLRNALEIRQLVSFAYSPQAVFVSGTGPGSVLPPPTSSTMVEDVRQSFGRNVVVPYGHGQINKCMAVDDVLNAHIIPDMGGPQVSAAACGGAAIASSVNSPAVARATTTQTLNGAFSTSATQTLALSSGQTQNAAFTVSSTTAALFTCHTADTLAAVSLITPSGTVITPANVASFPHIGYTSDPFGHSYKVAYPQAGTWTLRVTTGSQSATAYCSLLELASWEFVATTDGPAYIPSATVKLIAALPGNVNGLTVNTVTTTMINSSGTPLLTTSLYDDGTHGDPVAGDQVYSNTVTAPTAQGRYQLAFNSTGTYQGQSFQRYAQWSFDVLPSAQLFTGTFSTDPPQDTNGDGFGDQITERINLNLPGAGQYTMAADLFDGNGNVITHAVKTFSVTAGGVRQETLQFTVFNVSCSSFASGLRIRNLQIADAANGLAYLDVWTSDINLSGLSGMQFGCVGTVDADLAITSLNATPNPASGGNLLSYTITVKNFGPNSANAANVTANLPTMTTLVSCNSTSGGQCTGLGFSTASVTFSTLASGASATITLLANVNVSVVDGATLTMASGVSGGTTDTNPSNNSRTVTTRVSNITCGTASFGTAVDYAVGTMPRSLTIGDFNGDGKTDLAVANLNSLDVSVRLGNGLGGFGAVTNFAVEGRPSGIITADFNRDGKLDLAMANNSVSSVNVLILLGDGLGGFGIPTGYGVVLPAFGLAAADFNNDEKLDLAVYSSALVSIMLGDGAGGFSAPANLTVNSVTQDMTIGDFNRDGNADIAVVNNQTTNNVVLFLGDGTGGFSAPTIFNAGDSPRAIIAQDLNGDGKLDLAVGNQGSSNVSVFLGDGSGGFGAATNFAFGPAYGNIIAGDFNADGKADLACPVANAEGRVSIVLGDGAGGFGSPIYFPTDTSPFALTAGFFNGDGRLDLATANFFPGTISVLLGNCIANPTIAEYSPTIGTPGINVIISGTGLAGATDVKFNGLGANFSAIDSTTISAVVPAGATTGPIMITAPNGSAISSSNFTVCTTSLTPGSQNFLAAGGSGSIQVSAGTGCSWVASSNDNWIILANTNGTGTSFVGFVVVANTSASSRTGTISIGGQTFTVIQAGACGTITVNPASVPNGFVGVGYSQTFTQTAGIGTITWSVSAGTLPNNLSLNPSTGVLSGTPTTVGSFTFTIKVTDANGCMGTREYTVIIISNGLMYYPLPKPIRLFDTRAPIPGFPACQYLSQPLAANGELVKNARITCDGVTIPANAAAIVGNATVITPAAAGFITLWPDGQARPPVSNLNFSAGQVVPNAFTVGLSGAGDFRVFSTSNADFAVDVTGYFAPPSAGGLYYHPLPKPIRLFDTRATIPGFPACEYLNQPLVAGGELAKQARITCDGITIPADAMAIVGNATVVGASGGGFITLWPEDQPRPPVSNLNYVTGQTVPNAFTVGLAPDGRFRVYSVANTNFIVDITGYYSPSPTDANGAGLLYSPLSKPIRLFDTRATIPGFPACEYLNQALVANGELVKSAHTTCDGVTIPATAAAIVGNATVVQPAGNGFITLWPDGQARPPVSNLNYVTGQVVPNAFTVGLNASGNFRTFSFAGTHFIVDVTGFFAP